MRLLVQFVSGPAAGENVERRPDQALTIGRQQSQCDFAVSSDGALSRRHVTLFYDEQGWQLQDLDSRNGTFVNGERSARRVLRSGDRVRVGLGEFVVTLGDDAPATAADDGDGPPPAAPRANTLEPWLTALRATGYRAEPLSTTELEVRDRDDTRIRLSIDAGGRPHTLGLPSGRRWRLHYLRGRLAALSYPSGLRLDLRYDAAGRLQTLRCGAAVAVTLSHDDAGALRSIDYAGAAGDDLTAPPGADADRVQYDADSRVHRRRRGTQTERCRYADGGELIAVDGPGDTRWRFRYDGWDRPDRVEPPGGGYRCYRYDSGGRARRIDDPSGGVTLTYAGDADLPASLHFERAPVPPRRDADADGGATVLRFEYRTPAAGRPARVTAAGADRFDYDSLGRLGAARYGARAVRYGYGRERVIGYPSGGELRCRSDADGRPASLDDGRGARWRWRYEHGRRRHLRTLEYPNGLRQTDRFDDAGRCIEQRVDDANGAALWAARYRYDHRGRLAERVTRPGGAWRYRRDQHDRLCEVAALTADGGQQRVVFAYDDAGNLLPPSPARCRDHRLLAAGDVRFDYDAAGNLTRWLGPDARWTFDYDARGLVDSVVREPPPAGADAGPLRLSFGYDAFGRRIEKRLAGGPAWAFVWDGERLLGEYRDGADGAQQREYLYAPGALSPVGLRVDDAPYGCHADLFGALVLISDDAGRPVWAADYAAYGLCRPRLAALDNALGHPGHYHDIETGLVSHGARYYAPQLGRYLSPDRFGLIHGLHPYSYRLNDPLDPARHARPWRWPGSAAGVAGVSVETALWPEPPRADGDASWLNADSALALRPGSLLELLLSGRLGTGVDEAAAGDDATVAALTLALLSPALAGRVFEER